MTPDLGFPIDALGSWFQSHIAGFSELLSVTKFAGGQSNPTYRVDAASGSYVLRRKPFGVLLPSAHAVDREYRLMAALFPTGFPVPRPLALCTDQAVIGTDFYVMELVDGRTFWNGTLPDLNPIERTAIYDAMIDTLARLHAVRPQSVGLDDFGRPGNFFARQVSRWSKQYRASQTESIPLVERLMEWLPRTIPAQTRTTIVHGDYRIDNMIVANKEPCVVALLDWELATLGDPLADLTYFALSWALPADGGAGLQGVDFAALGIPTVDAVVKRYLDATDASESLVLDWYFAFALFRLLSISQGIKKRVLDGNASSTGAARHANNIIPFAELAWSFAERVQTMRK